MLKKMRIVVADTYCPLFGFISGHDNEVKWTANIIDCNEKQGKKTVQQGSTVTEIYNDILSSSVDEIIIFSPHYSIPSNDDLEIIQQLHNKHKAYDILIFQIQDFNKRWLRHYKPNEFDLDEKTIKSVLPFEITIKAKSIINNRIKFNKLFGPGGVFQYDLHRVFLYDALKGGLKIKYVPNVLTLQSLDVDKRMHEPPLERFYSAGATQCHVEGFDSAPEYLNYYLSKVVNNEFASEAIEEKYYFRAEMFLKGAYDYNCLKNLNW